MGTKFKLRGGEATAHCIIPTSYTVIQDIKLRLQFFLRGGGGLGSNV